MTAETCEPPVARWRDNLATRSWFVALLIVHVLIVWIVPVLPAQDLPQHLAYATIIAELGQPGSLFPRFYEEVSGYQSYYNTHYLLATLSRLTSVEAAARLVFTAYVVAFFFSFRLVVRAHAGPRSAQRETTSLAAAALVWNPVACMGLLGFLLAIPAILGGVAAFVIAGDEPVQDVPARHGPLAAIAGSVAIMSSLHVVATCLFAFFTVVYAASAYTPRRARALFVTLVSCLGATSLWWILGDSQLASHPLRFGEAINDATSLEFLNEVFEMTWRDPLAKLGYLLWNVLGPYPPSGQMVAAIVLAVCCVQFRKAKTRTPLLPDSNSARRVMVTASLALLIASWLMPWGVYRPSEVTFLDFRVMTVALCLLATTLGIRSWKHPHAPHLIGGGCLLLTLNFGARALAFGVEAQQRCGYSSRRSQEG